MPKTIFITGASSGIGKATAKFFQAKGWQVAATMRSPEKEEALTKLDNTICLPLDVTKPETIKAAIAKTIEKFGQIDCLVNNAGYGLIGLFESASREQIERQFNTNVFGLMEATKAILPYFRQQRSGVIINISSAAGRTTFPLYSLYNSTKWAVEGFSEALHFELEPFNIKVKIVEPGAITTHFNDSSADRINPNDNPEYADFIKRASAPMERISTKGSTPEVVAKVIFKAANDKNERLRYPAGSDAKLVLFLRKIMPESLFMLLFKKLMID